MASRRAVTVLILMQLIAFSVSAQQAGEFGRASGEELVMTAKGSAPISGSLSLSIGSDVFGRSSSPGYGVTAGGTLMQDRLWFFASASQQEVSTSRFANLELPESATTSAIGARVNGQVAGNQDFSAFFESARRPELSTTIPSSFGTVTPSSFLSLRYTGVISSNAFFSTSFTRSSRAVPGLGIVSAE
jgi:hypothetical protein